MADIDPLELTGGAAPDFENGEILFIGTATVLIRFAGFTVLTDPNFLHQGQHAPLGYGLRSRRLTEPARSIEELPPLDFVVLSHHHGDHFDEVAAQGLDKDLPIITTAHAAGKLRRQGFNDPRALETWETQTISRQGATVRITALPGVHAPQPLQALLPPVMGSMLDFSRDDAPLFRLYITGDTLVHDRLAEIPARYPDIDLALVHLGGTRVLGVLLTMDGRQGVEALRIIHPRSAIPIHYDDYTVFKSPLADFKAEVQKVTLPTEVHYLDRGESFEFHPSR
jgi:L-ascorbate metabolism protein UlaG (beta-lactamase superfamily)